MKKVDILQRVEAAGIIAVVRGESKEEAIKASHAIVKGGMHGLEITFTIPEAEEVIKELVTAYEQSPEVLVGAGTVLDATTARLAILAGADFIVSPFFNQETAELCNLYQVPYLPGCMTITEIQQAYKHGVDIIKLFPGSVYGPQIISAFKAPMPYINIMPTGGVSLENLEAWINAGAVAVGVGGNLLAPAATGEFEKVTEIASQYMTRYQEIKGA
ncbi:bifunctional 4-hydroxy-2-oxoglutarate aldolase/2-dehydro-3-deoxy-phosphogluconate aldolase [Enterococcus sp. AZ196]|uniref:bifunctional 4-hydroxy-2-oxoglutarate aldolase/2-dehydro-3-deoxy-phosphogluconate aldolase n=1 Tax=Enterococcus sp. AZ196 TaxID=2774659 RepID=UPI003D2B56BF